jgi:uncharacterized Zn finger protein
MLTEGRLRVLRVENSGLIVAECRGDSGEIYRLSYDHLGRWCCGCPAKGECSHLVALKLVTVRTAPVTESAVA